MDAVGLKILDRELAADHAVLANAANNASQWIKQNQPGRLEACAYELDRIYTTLERVFKRICEAFESHVVRSEHSSEKLVRRVALDLPGLRPAFVPAEALPGLHELLRFRHLVRHACDLSLCKDRLRELVLVASEISQAVPGWSKRFSDAVRREQR